MFQGYIKGLLLATLLAGLGWMAFMRFGSKLPDASQASQASFQATQTDVSAPFQEGKHYYKLSAKITSSRDVQQFISEDPGKIQVIEFFSYACYWCHRLHSHVNPWVSKKPSNVVFYRFPVVFSKGWDVLAKAFYIVQTVGDKTLDEDFFVAIHKNNIDLTNEKSLQEFFVKHGISEQRFSELYGSFEVNRSFVRGNEIISAFQITISPSIVLNVPSGSYLITVSMAGNEQGVVDVMNYLISREADPQKSSKPG